MSKLFLKDKWASLQWSWKKGNSEYMNSTLKSKEARHSTVLGNYKPTDAGGVVSGLTSCLNTRTGSGLLLNKHVNNMNASFKTQVCKNNFRPQLNFTFAPFLCQDVRHSK